MTFKLTKENYFSPDRPHISNSMITDYIRSRAFYKAKYIDRTVETKITDQMKLGSITDDLLTEGSTRYQRKFERTCLAKDDKEQYDIESQIIKEQKKTHGDYLVSAQIYDKAKEMAKYIQKHFFWQNNFAKVEFQRLVSGQIGRKKVCGLIDRLDPLPKHKYRLSDIKITTMAKASSPRKWLYVCQDAGYIRQFAIYQYLLAREKGVSKKDIECYHIVGVPDVDGFHKVFLYKMPQEYIDEAMKEVRVAIEGIRTKSFKDKSLHWRDAISL